MPQKQVTWTKKEFTTPSVIANLFQSPGWWFVQACQTYVHITITKKKKKNQNVIIVYKKQKNTSKWKNLASRDPKKLNSSTHLHLTLFEESWWLTWKPKASKFMKFKAFISFLFSATNETEENIMKSKNESIIETQTYQLFPAVSLSCFFLNLFNFLGSFGGTKSPSTSSELGLQSALVSPWFWDLLSDPLWVLDDKFGSFGSHERPITGLFSGILFPQKHKNK